jgi:pyruvate ferredoxin oxidoreductase gamma subunit/2-oxoisovalerate ferredoxin oxidoreductase gamma subunit
MVGAFARVLGAPPLQAVLEAIEEEIPVKTAQNIDAAQSGFDTVCMHGIV